jgi:hypothetical protein
MAPNQSLLLKAHLANPLFHESCSSLTFDTGIVRFIGTAMTKKKPRWMREFVWKIGFNLAIRFSGGAGSGHSFVAGRRHSVELANEAETPADCI